MDRRAIFTLAGCLLVGASAHAQSSSDVQYCLTESTTGFWFNQSQKKYEASRFNAQRFTLKWNSAAETVIISDPDFRQPLKFKCNFNSFYSCSDGGGFMYNFNPKTMQFIYALGFGHLNGKEDSGDSIAISHGKCSAF